MPTPIARPLVGALSLCALAISPAHGHARARDDGTVQVATSCASATWRSTLAFRERPQRLCVRWVEVPASAWARWHLVQRGRDGAPDIELASGPAKPGELAIDLRAHLPQYETGTRARDYAIELGTVRSPGDTTLRRATAATLTQLPAEREPIPARVDPYVCAPSKYPRALELALTPVAAGRRGAARIHWSGTLQHDEDVTLTITPPELDGFAVVRLANVCGHVQTTWVTSASPSLRGTLTSDVDPLDHDLQRPFETRAVVLNSTTMGFWTDYGAFAFGGSDDAFWWLAHDPITAQHSVLVEQRVRPG